jgi:polyferredoxin
MPSLLSKTSQTHAFQARISGPWIRTRKAAQYITLAGFLVMFLWTSRDGWPGTTVNVPMRLDPLLVLSHLLASRTLVAGSALALLTILFTLVFGRAWCGWICPLGTILDLISLHHWKGSGSSPPEGWRGVKYSLLLITLAAALLGNLTLLFFDPLAILLRTVTVSIWPALDRAVTWIEALLYPLPGQGDVVSMVDAWLRPAIVPAEPLYFRDTFLFAAFFVGLIALDLLASRFWCRYLCPLGGLLGIVSKASLFRREVTQKCKGCTLCTAHCPTGTIDPARGYASDPGECTMCLDCMEMCPRGITTFRPGFTPAGWREYDPGRRQALMAMGTAVAATVLFRADSFAARGSKTLLRPPGVPDTNWDVVSFTQCTRCAECIRICPTGALQPAVFDAGVQGLGSPILIPRLGYCDYSCNACGTVCPVQAIPRLSLEQKRVQVIGNAYIDENRCIAWSDRLPCIVCQEMCPLSDKAIQLEETTIWGRDGKRVDLQLPHVVRELCIGCGICEYKCPVVSEAAIRVYSSQADDQF